VVEDPANPEVRRCDERVTMHDDRVVEVSDHAKQG
jgi:hypothetical protein